MIWVKAFESCMRYLFAASAINMTDNKEKPEDSTLLNQSVIAFLKKLTTHFVLLYICKNGSLLYNEID